MLTPHQQKAKDAVLEYLKTSNVVLLKGSAGVGKTWLLVDLAKTLSQIGSVVCSAPTNNAVGVIEEKMIDLAGNITFSTLHSALKTKKKIDRKTGAVSFKPNFPPKYPPLKGVKYLIVDETSMVNKELFDYTISFADAQGTKIIFSGDIKQLPPIGEHLSQTFVTEIPTVELTEIVRQKEGNPIIDLSYNLSLIPGKVPNVTNEVYGYTYSNDRERIINNLASVNGTSDLKYIAYTNAEVFEINRDVRQKIYGTPAKIELGESIIFKEPYKEKYSNNQEVKVETMEIKTIEYPFLSRVGYQDIEPIEEIAVLKVYTINNTKELVEKPGSKLGWGATEMIEVEKDNIVVIHEDSEEIFKKVTAYMKTQASLAEIPWSTYYSFIEQFAIITYSHAMTIHRAQGQTFKQAIINVKNINFNRDPEEKEKMFYTAVTRASDLVILYNV